MSEWYGPAGEVCTEDARNTCAWFWRGHGKLSGRSHPFRRQTVTSLYPCQFHQEEINVPYIQGEFKEDRTYTVRYRPAMDEVLRLIEDPDLRGVLNMYPQRHYVCDPHGGPNMRVWTDIHIADDWWMLQVSFHPLFPDSL